MKLGLAQGTSNTTYQVIEFVNRGSVACVMDGYPGVNLAGGSPVAPIGLPAAHTAFPSAKMVTLQPGGAGNALLQITNARTYAAAGPDVADQRHLAGSGGIAWARGIRLGQRGAMDLEVADNPDKARFEILADGELAGFVLYHLRGDEIAFTHTETDDRFRGQGIAGHLVQASLDAARERHLKVLPYCPYVKRWLTEHREYVDLVPPDRRPQFGL